jgi:hypothetical protein
MLSKHHVFCFLMHDEHSSQIDNFIVILLKGKIKKYNDHDQSQFVNRSSAPCYDISPFNPWIQNGTVLELGLFDGLTTRSRHFTACSCKQCLSPM